MFRKKVEKSGKTTFTIYLPNRPANINLPSFFLPFFFEVSPEKTFSVSCEEFDVARTTYVYRNQNPIGYIPVMQLLGYLISIVEGVGDEFISVKENLIS